MFPKICKRCSQAHIVNEGMEVRSRDGNSSYHIDCYDSRVDRTSPVVEQSEETTTQVPTQVEERVEHKPQDNNEVPDMLKPGGIDATGEGSSRE